MVAVDQLIDGLVMILNVPSLLYIFAGVVVGVIIGAIPGLTTTMGMALFVPLTFFLDPLLGIPFLLGLYKGGVYGGAIPAILLSAPGTGAAVATVLDGYPLARQGKARSALQMALAASVIGDASSDIITVLFVAQITVLAAHFGPPEYFAILLFSVVMICLAAGGSLWKGLLSAGFGMMLASVGVDIAGQYRFTFGFVELSDGFSFVPMLIGLFAFSVIVERLIGHATDSLRKGAIQISEDDRLTWPILRSCLPTIARSTILGTILGIIPGIGQPVAALLGYSQAKRFSREPEKFGKGSYEGIAGPEAANNAVNGPSLVPLLSFGIPGDVITSVMLGAFMAHGLRPGPQLFETQGDIMYGILMGMVLANGALYLVGHYGSALFSKVAYVPTHLLMPAVFAVAVVGAFAVNSSLLDVGVMMVFGLIGYVLKKLDLPLSPLVITVLLARDIETNLIRSLILFGGSFSGFLNRPIAAVLLGATALFVVVPAVRALAPRLSRSQTRVASGKAG